MAFSERVQSITNQKILPNIVDAVLNSNVLFVRTMQNPLRWSGVTLQKPIKVSKSGTGGSFAGTDVFNTAAVDDRIRLSFDPKGFYQNVTVIGLEKAVNETDTQILSLVKASMEDARDDAMDSLGTIMYGTGTGNDFLGLDAIVDDGSSAGTYGTQSRTTFTQLKGTRTASGGTLTLTLMATLMTATSAASSARQHPTLGITPFAAWNLYESLLTPTVRANYDASGYPMVSAFTRAGATAREGQLSGGQGFTAITYRGMPIVADEKATSQTLFFLNENYLDFYSLRDADLQDIPSVGTLIDGVYTDAPVPSVFQWTGFKPPVNQYAEAGQLIAMGNLISWQPRRQGRLTGITTA